jgi:Holliday junction resolvasome RuvABC endonuclease subunit
LRGANIGCEVVLGIDISTSITGFAIVADGQLVHYDSIDLRKFKDVFAKTVAIKEKILDLYEVYQLNNGEDSNFFGESKYPIEHIYIEQPFTFFNSGGSSAKTMATLQKFNGIVSWIVYEVFEIKPEYIGASAARKLAGIKVPRGQKAKKVVLEHLLETEPAFNVEYTRHGNPKPESYDRADAIVVAHAGYKTETK